jgi:hypothetical protein
MLTKPRLLIKGTVVVAINHHYFNANEHIHSSWGYYHSVAYHFNYRYGNCKRQEIV